MCGCLDEVAHDVHQQQVCIRSYPNSLHTTDEMTETRAAVAANDGHTTDAHPCRAGLVDEDAQHIYRHAR